MAERGVTPLPMRVSLQFGRLTAIAVSALCLVPLLHAQALTLWGDNSYGECNLPAGLTDVSKIVAGEYSSMALKADGTVVAWGDNRSGEAEVPASVTNVIDVAAGVNFAAAVRKDGTVVCWGENSQGQCDVPFWVGGVSKVAAGEFFAVALKTDGTVLAWGADDYGQTDVPAGLNNVKQISAGLRHTLALKTNGTVVAWGSPSDGAAVVPKGLTGVVQVSAGYQHSLALKADGTVVAWGDNYYGQARVPGGLNGVVKVAAGGIHSMALKEDGSVVAWGGNYEGQCNVPAGLTAPVQLVAGYNHSFALAPLGLTLSSGTIYSGAKVTGRLYLTKTPGLGGANVPLTSTDPSITVPATVFVPEGKHSVTFAVQGGTPLHDATSTIRATYGGTSDAKDATLYGSLPLVTLSYPQIVGGSQDILDVTMRLGKPAPSAKTYTMGSDSAALSVPAFAFAKNAISRTVRATHALVTRDKAVTLTLPLSGQEPVTTRVFVDAPKATLAMTPNVFRGGEGGVAVVKLNAVFDTNIQVTFTSSLPATVQVPASIVIGAGLPDAAFYWSSSKVADRVVVEVSATVGYYTRVRKVTVYP